MDLQLLFLPRYMYQVEYNYVWVCVCVKYEYNMTIIQQFNKAPLAFDERPIAVLQAVGIWIALCPFPRAMRNVVPSWWKWKWCPQCGKSNIHTIFTTLRVSIFTTSIFTTWIWTPNHKEFIYIHVVNIDTLNVVQWSKSQYQTIPPKKYIRVVA